MKIKIYADGANKEDMLKYYKNNSGVSGFTTNPTLMRKAGVADYSAFAKEILQEITDLPISFEVFSDELPKMEQQAKKIAEFADNVYVKIPVTNTQGIFTGPIIKSLAADEVKLNITAVFTLEQVDKIIENLSMETPAIISIFAGRIANAGIDPVPIVKEAVKKAKLLLLCEILWASPREAFNIIQANDCDCHIITVTTNLLEAMKNFGKDLEQYSLETVKMFYNDAVAAGYTI